MNGRSTPPDPRTVASENLKPMYQDEFILGAQWAMGDWVFGAKGIYRKVKNGYDDTCTLQALADYATDNGFTDFDPRSAAPCYIINPGKDVKIALDLNNDGNLTNVTIPSRYFGLPDYRRSYKAVELTAERAITDKFLLQASYTWAKSEGNIEGYVNSSLEQADAGGTQDFDQRLFEDGAYGALPNDRRHTLKVFGNYSLTNEWSVSANALVQSGRPVNCLGYVPLLAEPDSGIADPNLGIDSDVLTPYGPSSFYCSRSQGVRVLSQRGSEGRTPWTYTLDLGIAYTPNWAEGLVVRADVFNLLNTQRVTQYSEISEKARVPVRTEIIDGDEVVTEYGSQFDPNFRNDSGYQAPRAVRLTLRYTW